jgi:hypothetical protein
MFQENRSKQHDCPVCYDVHDEEIHQATLRLRGWFHHYVTRRLEQDDYSPPPAVEEYPEARVA